MAWLVAGNLKGPKGDDGSAGVKGDQGDPGVKGDAGNVGPEGPEGPVGPPGLSLQVSGTFATYAELVAVTPTPGLAYIVGGLLYVATAGGWPADGDGVPFQGPQGVTGGQGDKGDKGDTGNAGAPGADGANGAPGVRGSAWYSGAGVPNGITGTLPGDFYLDTATGDIYSFS